MARLRRLGVFFAAKLVAMVEFRYSLAFLALLGMPAIFAALDFVAGAIGAILYSTALRNIRGIHIDIYQSADSRLKRPGLTNARVIRAVARKMLVLLHIALHLTAAGRDLQC